MDRELARVRAGLKRLSPHEAWVAMRKGALLVDIRDSARREANGRVPGALELEMTTLEWRLDATSEHASDQARDPERPVIIMCNEGFASSLAADRLKRLGREKVSDLIGGFEAWRAAGFVIEHPNLSPGRPEPA